MPCAAATTSDPSSCQPHLHGTSCWDLVVRALHGAVHIASCTSQPETRCTEHKWLKSTVVDLHLAHNDALWDFKCLVGGAEANVAHAGAVKGTPVDAVDSEGVTTVVALGSVCQRSQGGASCRNQTEQQPQQSAGCVVPSSQASGAGPR